MSSVYVCMIPWFVGWKRNIPMRTAVRLCFLICGLFISLLFVARLRLVGWLLSSVTITLNGYGLVIFRVPRPLNFGSTYNVA